MHDIWNPWHGCVRISEGCANCYMYTLDQWRGANGAKIYRTNNFDYPLQRTKSGEYRVKSGELIRVCMTSDFFLPEADAWRAKAWDIMYARPDVKFFLLTKRPERVRETLPPDFGDGWENIFFNVTCENQRRADERIPILLDLPFKHKGIMCAPFIGGVSIEPYLASGQIEQVICGGENYDGACPLDFEWVRSLHIAGDCSEAHASCRRGRMMHDIWNPWHGCVRISEGCANCYMYTLDQWRGANGAKIYRTNNFDYPLRRTKSGGYRVKSGELIRVCMTSDFFLPEADAWRAEVWNIMYARPDVKFFLLTKRPERVYETLPPDFGDGWENIFFNVTCENQRRADERIPILLNLPFKHKGIMCAPFIGGVSIEPYLASGQIEQVICGGENYDGARPLDFEWVKNLRAECVRHNVTFAFIETGTVFIKDGKTYRLPDKRLQSEMAHKSGMNFQGKPIEFRLCTPLGMPIPSEFLYQPQYDGRNCDRCGSRLICNGCSHCGACEKNTWVPRRQRRSESVSRYILETV